MKGKPPDDIKQISPSAFRGRRATVIATWTSLASVIWNGVAPVCVYVRIGTNVSNEWCQRSAPVSIWNHSGMGGSPGFGTASPSGYFLTQAFVLESHFMFFIFLHSALVFGASSAKVIGAVAADRMPAITSPNTNLESIWLISIDLAGH